MSSQILPNPYKRIESLERTLEIIGTWARVDVTNNQDKAKRSLPPCLLPQDVVALIGKVME